MVDFDAVAEALARIFGAHDGPWKLYSARDNYVFTTTKRLAKVAYKPGGDERLATGARLSDYLAKKGLPVTAPLLPYPVREDFGLVTLWPWVAHTPVESYELTGAYAAAVGSALASLSNTQAPAPAWSPFSRVGPRLKISRFPHATIERVTALVDQVSTVTADIKGSHVFSHGDAHAANVLFLGDGTISLIDLDYATMSPPGWDMACLWTSMVFENENQEGFSIAQRTYDEAGGVPCKDAETLSLLRILLGTTFQMTMPASPENLGEVDRRLSIIESRLS